MRLQPIIGCVLLALICAAQISANVQHIESASSSEEEVPVFPLSNSQGFYSRQASHHGKANNDYKADQQAYKEKSPSADGGYAKKEGRNAYEHKGEQHQQQHDHEGYGQAEKSYSSEGKSDEHYSGEGGSGGNPYAGSGGHAPSEYAREPYRGPAYPAHMLPQIGGHQPAGHPAGQQYAQQPAPPMPPAPMPPGQMPMPQPPFIYPPGQPTQSSTGVQPPSVTPPSASTASSAASTAAPSSTAGVSSPSTAASTANATAATGANPATATATASSTQTASTAASTATASSTSTQATTGAASSPSSTASSASTSSSSGGTAVTGADPVDQTATGASASTASGANSSVVTGNLPVGGLRAATQASTLSSASTLQAGGGSTEAPGSLPPPWQCAVGCELSLIVVADAHGVHIGHSSSTQGTTTPAGGTTTLGSTSTLASSSSATSEATTTASPSSVGVVQVQSAAQLDVAVPRPQMGQVVAVRDGCHSVRISCNFSTVPAPPSQCRPAIGFGNQGLRSSRDSPVEVGVQLFCAVDQSPNKRWVHVERDQRRPHEVIVVDEIHCDVEIDDGSGGQTRSTGASSATGVTPTGNGTTPAGNPNNGSAMANNSTGTTPAGNNATRSSMAPVGNNGTGTTPTGAMISTTPVPGNGSLPPPWHCTTGCELSLLVMAGEHPVALSAGVSANVPRPLAGQIVPIGDGCHTVSVACNVSLPAAEPRSRCAISFGKSGRKAARRAPFVDISVQLFCAVDQSPNKRWVHVGADEQRPHEVVVVDEIKCDIEIDNGTAPVVGNNATTPAAPANGSTTALVPTSVPPEFEDAAPPSGFNCTTGCLLDDVHRVGTPAPFFEGAFVRSTCQKAIVDCSATEGVATIGFGTEGTLQSKSAPFRVIRALLYCVRDSDAKFKWLRVGVEGQQQKTIFVSEVHCQPSGGVTGVTPASNSSAPTELPTTAVAPTNIPPGSDGGAPPPFQCATGCALSELRLAGTPLPVFEGLFEKPAGCQKTIVDCSSNMSKATIEFGTEGSLQAKDAPFRLIRALLYCVRDTDAKLKWLRQGVEGQPQKAFIAGDIRCQSAAINGSTPPQSVTGLVSTTQASNSSSGAGGLPPAPWQCANQCKRETLQLKAAATGVGTPVIEQTSEQPSGCQKMVVSCQSPAAISVIKFGELGSVQSKQSPFLTVRVQLFCVKDTDGAFKWLRVGTTEDANKAFTTNECQCEKK